MTLNIENGKKILQALTSAGANPVIVPKLLSQIALETAGFNSRVFKENNNGSGIMFINNPTRQKNATRGRAFPRNEWPAADKPLYYANFNSLKDWAIDYLRLVKKSAEQSTNFEQFAVALKNRRYYGATVSSYTKGMIAYYNQLNKTDLFKNIAATGSNILPLFIGAVIVAYLLF
jgi:hypothetical protein